MFEKVSSWLKDGCKLQEGLTLYLEYGDNEEFKVLAKRHPESCRNRIKFLLCALAGIQIKNYSSLERKSERDKFRALYPFLSDRNIPNEIKILASDKISTYWRMVELHNELFACHKNSDCVRVARELVDVFIEDESIKKELNHYRDYKKVLGQHRVFKQSQAIDSIRRMSLKELFRKEKQLRDNIWRIKSEIAKNDKPQLLTERLKRLEDRERELEIVIKMIG